MNVIGDVHADDAGNIAYYVSSPGIVPSVQYGSVATGAAGQPVFAPSTLISSATFGNRSFPEITGLGTDLVMYGDEFATNDFGALYMSVSGTPTIVDLRPLASGNFPPCFDPQDSFGTHARVYSISGRTLVFVGDPQAYSVNRPGGITQQTQCTDGTVAYSPDGCIWVFDVTDPANPFSVARISAPAVGPASTTSSYFGSSFDLLFDQATTPPAAPILYVGAPFSSPIGLDPTPPGLVMAVDINVTATTFTWAYPSALDISAPDPNGTEFGYEVEARGPNLMAKGLPAVFGGAPQIVIAGLVFQANVIYPNPPMSGSTISHDLMAPTNPANVNPIVYEEIATAGTSATNVLRWNGGAWGSAAGPALLSGSNFVDAGSNVAAIRAPYGDVNDVALLWRNFSGLPHELYGGGVSAACLAATTTNSTGVQGEISSSGSPRFGDNALTLTASGLPGQSLNFFINSLTEQNPPTMNIGGSQGSLCLNGAVGRFAGPGQIQNASNAGTVSLAVDLTMLPTPTGTTSAVSGETWYFQNWYRDTVGGAATSNLTNSIGVLIQ